MPEFGALLSAARRRAGISQEELARRLGLSPATLASWETGRRRPSSRQRPKVILASDAFGSDAWELNEMLGAAGLPPVSAGRQVPLLDRRKPLTVIRDECAEYTWPTLAMNEDFEAVAWNDAINDIAELDFATDLAEPGARHLLRLALDPRVGRKLVNWDEPIRIMVSMWKSTGFDPLASGAPTPYFQNLMAYVFTHHGAEVPRLLQMWQEVSPYEEGLRLEFEVQWRTSDGSMLRFHNQLTPWSDFDAIAALDWHPADATTWDWLDQCRRARGNRERSADGGTTEISGAPAMLRFARERSGLSRKALAARAGLTESLIFAIEHGRKALTHVTLRSLCQAMALDSASMNAILEAAGFEPEASDMTAYILGYGAEAGRFSAALGMRRHLVASEAARKAAGYPWPMLVVDERCEIVGISRPASLVLGLDLRRLPAGPERNLFSIVSASAFRRRTVNWEEAVQHVLPGNLEPYMAPPEGHRGPGKDVAYFEGVIRHVRDREIAESGSDRVIHELFAAWRKRPNRRLSGRITFPLLWDDQPRQLAFNTIITPWNSLLDPYWAIDLHPADGDTWRELARLQRA